MGSPRRLKHNQTCIVLNSLQFLDGVGRCAMKHGVAVVDPEPADVRAMDQTSSTTHRHPSNPFIYTNSLTDPGGMEG